jgi:hypothetical protein
MILLMSSLLEKAGHCFEDKCLHKRSDYVTQTWQDNLLIPTHLLNFRFTQKCLAVWVIQRGNKTYIG